MTDRVRIYEVGPRDGLQNEATPIALETKVEFIERLVHAGLREIEATSFVSPKAIPQLADADDLLPRLPRDAGVRYPVLVPNERGMARAEAAGADALAVFTAATDAFTERNIGMTVDESLAAFEPVLRRAEELGWWRRAYVSTAFGCPYTGAVDPHRAVNVATRLLELGVDEVCFGDTIGVGVPAQVAVLTGAAVQAGIPVERDRVPLPRHARNGARKRGRRVSTRASAASTAPPAARAAVPTRPGQRGISRPRTSSTCSTPRASSTAWTSSGCSTPPDSSPRALGRPLASKVGQAGGWDAATGAPIGR